MKTVNQFNSFFRNNLSIQFYQKLCDKYERFESDYRLKYWYFKKRHVTIKGTFLYSHCFRLITLFLGFRFRDKTIYYNPYSLIDDYLLIRYEIDLIKGLIISVFNQTVNVYKPLPEYFEKPIKSNNPVSWFFDEQNLINYVEKNILNEYLFPKNTLFRKIQEIYKCDKKEAIEKYKYFLNQNKLHNRNLTKHEIHVIKYNALVKRLRKKLNINVDVDSEIKYSELLNLLIKNKRFKKMTTFAKAPSYFDVLDGFDGDVDELFDHYNEYINDHYDKNTVLF